MKRKGRRGERGRIWPAAMARSSVRLNPVAAGAHRLDPRLAGRACSPGHAGRASRGSEEAAEAEGRRGEGGSVWHCA